MIQNETCPYCHDDEYNHEPGSDNCLTNLSKRVEIEQDEKSQICQKLNEKQETVSDLFSVLAGIAERWDQLVPEEEVSEEHKRARAALAKATGQDQ